VMAPLHSYGGDGGDREPTRARQASGGAVRKNGCAGWCAAMPPARSVPELAERQAEPEQAVDMERTKRAPPALLRARRNGFHRVVSAINAGKSGCR